MGPDPVANKCEWLTCRKLVADLEGGLCDCVEIQDVPVDSPEIAVGSSYFVFNENGNVIFPYAGPAGGVNILRNYHLDGITVGSAPVGLSRGHITRLVKVAGSGRLTVSADAPADVGDFTVSNCVYRMTDAGRGSVGVSGSRDEHVLTQMVEGVDVTASVCRASCKPVAATISGCIGSSRIVVARSGNLSLTKHLVKGLRFGYAHRKNDDS